MTPKLVFLAHSLVYLAALSASPFWMLNRYLELKSQAAFLIFTPKCFLHVIFLILHDDSSILLVVQSRKLGVRFLTLRKFCWLPLKVYQKSFPFFPLLLFQVILFLFVYTTVVACYVSLFPLFSPLQQSQHSTQEMVLVSKSDHETCLF